MKLRLFAAMAIALAAASWADAQTMKVNDLEYFEDRGVNFLVYSNEYNGMFCDEKTAAIEMI